jgi:hydroxymethylpyrimidine kinase/phosphomethylpyrimidine kinase/thiamine-phosphate diphosphorylase
LEDAFVLAKTYISRALRKSTITPQGISLLTHGLDFASEDMPQIVTPTTLSESFPKEERLGFYPIVNRASEVEKLYRWGVSVVQLRVKDLTGERLENEIQLAIAHSKAYQRKIYINDYWDLAIRYGAYGVHLGQEDLDTADLRTMVKSQIRLGISTHSLFELARALGMNPSYVALGPIFPTTLKTMKFAPQGISRLSLWRSLTHLPLIAIGGITLEKAPEIIKTEVDGISVVGDIANSEKVEERVAKWLHLTGPTLRG